MVIIPIGGEGMRRWLERLTKKDGFYIILFIFVCIVAITTVLTSKRDLQKRKGENLSHEEDYIIIEDELDLESSLNIEEQLNENLDEFEEEYLEYDEISEEPSEDIKEAMAEEEIEGIEEEIEEDLESVEMGVSTNIAEDMILPVEGEIAIGYTKDSLVYSETLEEWTAHKGIDILALEGTPVVAALSGVVQEVYKDELWGMVIIIDHGSGLLTKYANMAEEIFIEEGSKVNKGEVIGKVGRTALIEVMMEPHIHFEVIKDGLSVDPKDYMSALDY